MKLDAAAAEFRRQFEGQVALPFRLTTVYDDTLEPEDKAAPWARVSARVVGSICLCLGKPSWRRYTVVGTIQLFAPAGDGPRDVERFASHAADVFSAKRVGGLLYTEPAVPERVPNDTWAQVNVNCVFTFEDMP